ncbi:unnamed protein product [Cuscuta campestris]|uniref:Uncharacterized protein n=1 Tax=Cuscuta campestris TaxID=132261 RepID=A0A484LUX2_9ASTE|nr:unnamed protein product [Cuscuta campestris]
MPRYDDRYGGNRLYVGHLSSRTRTRDLEDIFSRYGRVRDVDMKRDYAFVEFSDPRDADDAIYRLNGREVDGSRIIVQIAKGVPRGPGGSREYSGRAPAPGTGRCFNCGIEGHWARDCKDGDWKNKCYRCGERGHIEKNCHESSKKSSGRARSYSRSPSPRRDRHRSRSYSRGRSYSRSRSPAEREHSLERRSRSPPRQRKSSPPPSKERYRSPSPDERSPRRRGTPSPQDDRPANGGPENGRSRPNDGSESDDEKKNMSPPEENVRSRSNSPIRRRSETPSEDEKRRSPRGSESP